MKRVVTAVLVSGAVSAVATWAIMRPRTGSSGRSRLGATTESNDAAPRHPGFQIPPSSASPPSGTSHPRETQPPLRVASLPDLESCRRELVRRMTIDERYAAGDADFAATEALREKIRDLPLAESQAVDVECRAGVCLLAVTTVGGDGNDEWMQAIRTRGLFTAARYRTSQATSDSYTMEVMFETSGADSAEPMVGALMEQVADQVGRGPPECPHGQGMVELRVAAERMTSEVLGTECLHAIVEGVVRAVDVRGKADLVMSRAFHW